MLKAAVLALACVVPATGFASGGSFVARRFAVRILVQTRTRFQGWACQCPSWIKELGSHRQGWAPFLAPIVKDELPSWLEFRIPVHLFLTILAMYSLAGRRCSPFDVYVKADPRPNGHHAQQVDAGLSPACLQVSVNTKSATLRRGWRFWIKSCGEERYR